MKPPPSIVRIHDLGDLAMFDHEAMATRFRLHLSPPLDGSPLRPIAEEAFRHIDRIEEKLSFYRDGSDITRINRAKENDVLRIDEITHACLLQAMEVAAATQNAFDPFAGHLALSAKEQSLPQHLRDVAMPEASDNSPVLAIDPQNPIVTKMAGRRWLDLGAIGKGAALDAVAELLQEWSVPAAVLIGGGSSILVVGTPPQPGQEEWELTLPQSPGNPRLSLAAPFALGASGEGFQPGHIINHEDQKARPQCLVLAPTAALADALSTAAVLLPDDKLRNLLSNDSRFAVFATQIEAPSLSTGVFAQERVPPPPEVTLVIPCWCESERLPNFLSALAEQLSADRLPVEILVVDDASPGQETQLTAHAVERVRKRFPLVRSLLRVDRHYGKGGAVYWGWKHGAPTSRWLAFVDADGAVPVAAVLEGLNVALSQSADLPVIAANRYHRDPTKPVSRSWIRQLTGAWFARWARGKLDLPAADCQCGFKLIPARWWRLHAPSWREEGYAFDLELLLSAAQNGLTVRNLDIPWQEISGSHVGLRDGLRLVRTVVRLRKSGA